MGAPDDPPKPIAPVIVTEELLRRPPANPDYLREKLAIQDLAHRMAERPGEVIPRLVALAMEICDGASAGVSVLDRDTNRLDTTTRRTNLFIREESKPWPRIFNQAG